MADYSDATIEHTTGRYQLHERIGQGTQGEVYRSSLTMSELGVVAVKVYHRFESGSVAEHMFQAEVNAAELWHPQLAMVRAVDIGQIALNGTKETVPFVAMEHLPRGSLKGEVLSPEEILTMIDDLAEGLEYLHENGLVHGDVKTSNIYPHRGGYKLADFGNMLPIYSKTLGRMEYTTYSKGCTSPDQLDGKPTAASDVYSTGRAVMELMTGIEAVDIPKAQLLDTFMKDHRELAPIEKVLRAATDESPKRRIDTMRTFADDLRAALSEV